MPDVKTKILHELFDRGMSDDKVLKLAERCVEKSITVKKLIKLLISSTTFVIISCIDARDSSGLYEDKVLEEINRYLDHDQF